MDIRFYALVLLFLLDLFHKHDCQTLAQSKTLTSDMLNGYDKRQRPVLDQSKTLVVNVSFDIVAIQDFDEVKELFSAVGVLYLTWVDESISWNPMSYGGIWSQMYRIDDVWYPVLILANPYNKVQDLADDWMTVRILYNGVAYFSPGAVLKSTCSVDVTYYPFDTQTCTLLFIPWGFSTAEMSLNAARDTVLRSFYSENGEWELVSTRVIKDAVEDQFESITFSFTIKRKPLFLVVNVILPIIFMAIINLLVFLLPVESGERVSYAVTVLLSIAVFLTLVSDNLPKISQPMSVLCYFLMLILVISTLMCVVTILNLKVYHSKRETIPTWVKFITRVLACSSCKSTARCRKNQDQVVDEEHLKHQIHIVNMKKKGNQLHKTPVVAFEEPDTNMVITWMDVSAAVDKIAIIGFTLLLIISVSVYLNILARNKPAGT